MLWATAAQAQSPLGEMRAADVTVRGAVTLHGDSATLHSGAQISTADKNAALALTRGGALRVCSQSTITLTASASGREQLIGLNSGAIETHYPLGPSSDVVMTPDFRMQLAGPGAFHFAIRTGAQGETCVQSLPGNTAALIVSELMGDGVHQVKPGEHVVFRNGSVADAAGTLAPCGCPEERAEKDPRELDFPEEESRRAAAAAAEGRPITQPPAPLLAGGAVPGEVQTQVDVPMVFTAAPEPAVAEPAPAYRERLAPAPYQPVPVPEPAAPAKVKKKWYQRLGAALASLFRSKG
jgi:hypothetical protein